jgi:hypothetical protein
VCHLALFCTVILVLSIPQVRLRTVDNYQGEEGRVSFPQSALKTRR